MNNMDLNELELYELLVDGEEDGVFAVSAVSEPAIERGFVYMNKQEIFLQSINDEKRLVAGPLLLPNKKILRVSEDGLPYAIYFSPETIETIARKFMKNKYNGEVTVEHDRKVDGVYLTENWIIDTPSKDKSNQWGFVLPKGSWFGVYKVENEQVWQDIKSGKLKGFSVEALLEHKISKVNPKQLFSSDMWDLSIEDLSDEQAEFLLGNIKAMLKKKVKLESYSDYGDDIKNNAKKVLDYVDRNGWGSCGTPIGKTRVNQLAKGEPISLETIKRMYSYLSRHEKDLEVSKSYSDGCGKLMYDSWGGLSALSWTRNKLRELGELELAGEKISFDYHETLSTERGMLLAKKLIDEGYDLYVISAGQNVEEFYKRADELGIPHSKLYATGSNTEKVKKIKELGITKHYDNNSDVVKELGNIGVQFEGVNPSISSTYPGQGPDKKKKDEPK